MTTRRALQILYRVWGSEGVISQLEVDELAAVELPGETSIVTAGRIAGVRVDDLRHDTPKVWMIIRDRVAAREVELCHEKDARLK